MERITLTRNAIDKLAALSLSLVLTSPLAAQASPGCWSLVQKSDLAGDYDVRISATAICMSKRTGAIKIYASAPDWKVVLLNDKTRTYFQSSVRDFAGDPKMQIYQTHVLALRSGKWEKLPDGEYRGKIIARYKTKYQGEFAEDLSFKMTNRHSQHRAMYGELPGVTLPLPLLQLLRKVYVLPEFSGIPIVLNGAGDASGGLSTLKIEECDKVPRANVPPGYKRVSSTPQVYGDPHSAELLDSLSNWLEPGEKAAKPKSKLAH